MTFECIGIRVDLKHYGAIDGLKNIKTKIDKL